MPDDHQTVTLETFTRIAGKSDSTIYKRRNEIPGLEYENGEYRILEGTRYPADLHRYQIDDSSDKRYVLLRTISKYQYIDAEMLRIYPRQFENMLSELQSAGLIAPNGMANNYGANGYDCTPAGDAVLKLEKHQAKIRLAELVGIGAGAFASGMTNM